MPVASETPLNMHRYIVGTGKGSTGTIDHGLVDIINARLLNCSGRI